MSDERWMRIDRLLQSALGRPPHEREAFIRDACPDDDGVRDEVLSLLAHAGSSDKFLEPPPKREPLQSGARLGAYEIRAHIGEGGMGEVYRAHDSRLRRDVALKILPPEAADAERRRRFAHEAQAVAALNHPGIVTIYSVEQSGDIHFLTMELVDGQTLDVLTPAGGLPIDRLLALAIPLADAVGAAHSQGIVHRDLKPANVMVTRDGRVKVMDFGLAKLTRRGTLQDVKEGNDAAVTTMAGRLTEDGRIFGTVAYMSPEQAEGRDVDHRSDVFSLGVLLFELATGRRPFKGESQVAVLASIVKDTPPPVTDLKPGLPAEFARLVRKCLAKDPGRRYQSVLDVRNDLEEIGEDLESPDHAGGARKPRRLWLWLTAGLAAGLVVAALASFAYWWLRPNPARPNVGFQRVTDAVGMEESPAISPDGKMVAFTAFSGRRRHLFVRALAGGVSQQVTNDDLDHEQPRWAPDSITILYLGRSASGDQSALYEIPFTGGPPRPIASALTGGDISPLDGQKIAVFQAAGAGAKLVVIGRDGTPVTDVVSRTPGRLAERTPRWAPDGRSIAYIDSGQIGFDDAIKIVSAAGGEPPKVVREDIVRGLSWLPDASGLVFGSGLGTAVTYPPTFHLRVVRFNGAANEQLTSGVDSLTDPDVHQSGLVLATRTVMNSAIWEVPATGTPAVNLNQARIVTHLTSQVQTPSASPDGKEIVYLSDSGGHGNLWVIGVDGEGRRQLTTESNPSVRIAVPVWSPDGSMIAFLKVAGAKSDQWLVNRDGTNSRMLLEGGVSASWSPDGKWIYYAGTGTDGTCIRKIRLVDKFVEAVQCGNAIKPMRRKDGTLFFEKRIVATSGGFDSELYKANPENSSNPTALRRIDARQIPYDSRLSASSALSPDGAWVALALMKRATTNLWRMSTESGELHQVTDFGDRATWMVRQVTWSFDSKFIYAAIADLDADIVSIAGVVSGKGK